MMVTVIDEIFLNFIATLIVDKMATSLFLEPFKNFKFFLIMTMKCKLWNKKLFFFSSQIHYLFVSRV